MVGFPSTFFHPSRSVSIGFAALRPNFVTLLFATRHSLSSMVHANSDGPGGCGTAAATISPDYPAIYFQFRVTDEQGQWPNISWCQRESDRSASDRTINDKVRALSDPCAATIWGFANALRYEIDHLRDARQFFPRLARFHSPGALGRIDREPFVQSDGPYISERKRIEELPPPFVRSRHAARQVVQYLLDGLYAVGSIGTDDAGWAALEPSSHIESVHGDAATLDMPLTIWNDAATKIERKALHGLAPLTDAA